MPEASALVPWRYRNVVCPWMWIKDIEAAVKFCDRIWAGIADAERRQVFRLDEERTWE